VRRRSDSAGIAPPDPTTGEPAVTTAPGLPPLPGPQAPPIDADVPIITEPAPDEMCDQGSVPQAAAYDFDDVSFLWVSCAEEAAWRTVRAVTDDAVYIETGTSHEVTALDPETGEVLSEEPQPPPREDVGSRP
jgi:hypothetical protein